MSPADHSAHATPTRPGEPDAASLAEAQPSRRSDRPSGRPGGPTSLVGQVLSGRYRIVRLLGEGAMGAVYEAEHVHMRKRMAVKVLHPEMTRRPEIVERFEREAVAAGNIDHPNVAAASDFGRHEDGSFFLVLEYVVGKSLREALDAGRLELGRALHITRQIASAVGRAHELRIVHRDLKPENVMLVERQGDFDFVKVLDFGIAKVPPGDVAAEISAGAGEAPPASRGPVLTRAGMIFGTPDYMAPEQALGDAVDARADLYSVGILAFELLTGVRPFEHENAATLLMMQISAPAPSMASMAPAADVPPAVEAIVARLLEKDPALRFQTAADLVSALTQAMVELSAAGRIQLAIVALADASGPMSVAAKSLAAAVERVSLGAAPTRLPEVAQARTAHTPLMDIVDVLSPIAQRAQAAMKRHAPGVSGRVWLLAGAGVVLAVLVGVALLAAFAWNSMKASTAPDVPPGSAAPLASTAPQSSASSVARRGSPTLADQIALAEASLQRADYGAAISRLTPLEEAHPDDALIHHDLERAYMGAGDLGPALREGKAWLASDHAPHRDAKFEQDVKNAALGAVDPEDAFALLERMGTAGAEILYDIAYGTGHASAAERARVALASPAVRTYAGPAITVTLDLRNARTCDAKEALLARARDVGDARTSALLKGYKSTSGCGFLNRRDCWPCMRKDGALAEAIAAIDDRAAKAPRP